MDLNEELDEITRETASETNFMNYYTSTTTNVPHEGTLVKAVFGEQPPANMRKSNFFHFTLSFYDEKDNSIEVEKGIFSGYPNEDEKMKDLRNGLVYQLQLKFADGHQYTEEILVTLINSQTEEIIRYEGIDKNPDMCRVLLTHEKMCSRCQGKKSCGNRNETPSDCIIMGKDKVKFFMKCNQNCLKSAGNPKDVRRFQLVISTTSNIFHPLAKSNNMFVHNNSKHGRRPNLANKNNLPFIKCLIPADGWTNGGSQIVVIGKNFEEGIQVLFGNCLVWIVEVFSNTSLRLILPPRSEPGVVEVYLSLKSKPIYQNPPALFTYNSMTQTSIDCGFQRLSKYIPRHPGDQDAISKETILNRAADIMESLFAMQPVQIMVPTQNLPSARGMCSNFHGYLNPNPSYHPCYFGSSDDYLRPNLMQSKPGPTPNDSSAVFVQTPVRNDTCSNGITQRPHGYTSEPRCSNGHTFCNDNHCSSANVYNNNSQASFSSNCIYSSTPRNEFEIHNNTSVYSEDTQRPCANSYSIKSRSSISLGQTADLRSPVPPSSCYNNTPNNTAHCQDTLYTNVIPYTKEAHSINNIVYKSVLKPTHAKSNTSTTICGDSESKRLKLDSRGGKCFWGDNNNNSDVCYSSPVNTANTNDSTLPLPMTVVSNTTSNYLGINSPLTYGSSMMSYNNNNCTPQQQQQQQPAQCNRVLNYNVNVDGKY